FWLLTPGPKRLPTLTARCPRSLLSLAVEACRILTTSMVRRRSASRTFPILLCSVIFTNYRSVRTRDSYLTVELRVGYWVAGRWVRSTVIRADHRCPSVVQLAYPVSTVVSVSTECLVNHSRIRYHRPAIPEHGTFLMVTRTLSTLRERAVRFPILTSWYQRRMRPTVSEIYRAPRVNIERRLS